MRRPLFWWWNTRPEALAAARALEIPEVEWVAAEAIAFLAANLRENSPWDWLIPMVPVHVAWAWLLAGPLKGWETAAVPEELEQLAPVRFRGPEGQLYLSRAAHLCPDDCPEPDSSLPGERRVPGGAPVCRTGGPDAARLGH